MHPVLIRAVTGANDELAGFEQVAPDDLELLSALTPKQRAQWDKLPDQFRFEEAADKVVPRSTLSRLIQRGRSIGALRKTCDGIFEKVGGGQAGT